MTGDQFRAVCDFESNVTIGAPCLARWTNAGGCMVGAAKVAKINRKTFVVELTESIRHGRVSVYTYPAGRLIHSIPRIDNIENWSVANRLEPVGGYQEGGKGVADG